MESKSEEERDSIPQSTLSSEEEDVEEETRTSLFKLMLEEVEDLFKGGLYHPGHTRGENSIIDTQ